MKQLPKFHRGFTLIEILVVIAVILIILAFSYAGYATLNQRQRLISAGQNMKNILRDAQSRAYNSEVDCTVCDCSVSSPQILAGWYVDFTNNIYYGKCGLDTKFNQMSFNLPSDISIVTNPATINQLYFLHNPPSASDDVIVCLYRNSQEGIYYVIKVSKSGDIADKGTFQSLCG